MPKQLPDSEVERLVLDELARRVREGERLETTSVLRAIRGADMPRLRAALERLIERGEVLFRGEPGSGSSEETAPGAADGWPFWTDAERYTVLGPAAYWPEWTDEERWELGAAAGAGVRRREEVAS